MAHLALHRLTSVAAPRSLLAASAVAFELVLACAAFAGATLMIADPDGGLAALPLELLAGTPFRSWLWPGIALALALGVFPVAVALATLERRADANLHALVGAVLMAWVTLQVLLLPGLRTLHVLGFLAGLLLLGVGAMLRELPSSVHGTPHGKDGSS